MPALRDHGFRGGVYDYDDPRNSFLHEVLQRRRGLPIALATVALAVAGRVGAPLVGVGLPGHFVVSDRSGADPVVIDPFNGWVRLDLAQCARLVERTAGVPFRLEFLDPVEPREILARTLRNLRGSYMRRRRLDQALWTVEVGLIVSARRRRAGPRLDLAAQRHRGATRRPRTPRPRSWPHGRTIRGPGRWRSRCARSASCDGG